MFLSRNLSWLVIDSKNKPTFPYKFFLYIFKLIRQQNDEDLFLNRWLNYSLTKRLKCESPWYILSGKKKLTLTSYIIFLKKQAELLSDSDDSKVICKLIFFTVFYAMCELIWG